LGLLAGIPLCPVAIFDPDLHQQQGGPAYERRKDPRMIVKPSGPKPQHNARISAGADLMTNVPSVKAIARSTSIETIFVRNRLLP
jgi:hypothetical protein